MGFYNWLGEGVEEFNSFTNQKTSPLVWRSRLFDIQTFRIPKYIIFIHRYNEIWSYLDYILSYPSSEENKYLISCLRIGGINRLNVIQNAAHRGHNTDEVPAYI